VESAEVERFNSKVSTLKGEDGWMTCVVVQIVSLEDCEVGCVVCCKRMVAALDCQTEQAASPLRLEP
jgi:hypothetical protein